MQLVIWFIFVAPKWTRKVDLSRDAVFSQNDWSQ